MWGKNERRVEEQMVKARERTRTYLDRWLKETTIRERSTIKSINIIQIMDDRAQDQKELEKKGSTETMEP